jgi:peptidoglycan/LPS O-acetylase OafA/YrhL
MSTDTGRAHLHSIDLVRVLTVGLVIGVHTVSVQPGGTGLTNGALLTVLHVSREVFFLLTAFVLTYSYRDREPRWPAFWRRRYLLIGVPYLVWSTIYFVAHGNGLHLDRLLRQLVTGTAEYHLYFLLVSMQLYLVFPLLRRLLRAATGRHGWLLAGAVAYQIGIYALAPENGLLSSYLGFVIAGGIAAAHADALFAWTRTRKRLILAGTAPAVAAGVGWFFLQVLVLGRPAPVASAVFQPIVVVESFAIAWTFLALGLAWQDRGTPGRRWVRTAADASFGVYLAHPLVLLLIVTGGLGAAARLPGPAVTAISVVVAVPLVYLFCVSAVAGLRRTPLSLPLTGHFVTPVTTPSPTGGLRCERQAA